MSWLRRIRSGDLAPLHLDMDVKGDALVGRAGLEPATRGL
jgi:hypothetical protein